MRELLLVGGGGLLGSVARYLLSSAVTAGTGRVAFPLGTLAVNVLGCLVIGALAGAGARSGGWSESARLFLFTGVLGGFTTFSAFGYETFALARDGRPGLAVLNVAMQLTCGLLAVFAGYRLAG